MLIIITSDKDYMAKVAKENAAYNDKQKILEARQDFASKISDKFELPHGAGCVARFYAEGEENKTLRVRPCSILFDIN